MSMSGGFLAIDWGTTNRRVYCVGRDGGVVDSQIDGLGVSTLGHRDYDREIAALRARFGDLPVLAAGMVGSSIGWHEVPYCDLPASVDDLASGAVRLENEVTLLPGLANREGLDSEVMRGEEVQVFGAAIAGLAPSSSIFCQPGTHSKWITLDKRRVTGFSTAMTGELFALLRAHSVLASMLTADVEEGAAFTSGLQRGLAGANLSVGLFRIRAAVLLDEIAENEAQSYLSGLLIGSEIGSQGQLAGKEVCLLASRPLASLYRIGIEEAGASVRNVDSQAAFVAGVHAVRKAMS